MRLALALLFALPFALGACKQRKVDSDESQPAGPSTMTIANVIGVCDDLAQCERECDAGQADRCRRLGATYQFARGTDKDEAKATSYYELACKLGNASACVSAGQMYEYAHGVKKDDAKAAGFYKQGCDVGYMVGCANYAIMLENGRGVTKDIPQAIVLYQNACKAGAGLACERLNALTRDAAPAPSK